MTIFHMKHSFINFHLKGLVPYEPEMVQLADGDVIACRTWPCWGTNIKCGKGTDVSYGPWVDRQRWVILIVHVRGLSQIVPGARTVSKNYYLSHIILLTVRVPGTICESPLRGKVQNRLFLCWLPICSENQHSH